MYAFIKGILDSVSEGAVVVENNGIGYNINVSNNVLTRLPAKGSEVKLYTHTYVKEDAFSLYGFLQQDEKNMFLKLINVSGVGCKVAMQILSAADATSLALAIANKDISALSKIKGIGKKTAERIILELKEKVDVSDITGAGVSVVSADNAVNDAIMALVALGIAKTDAYKAVMKARERTDKTEQIITIALRSMDN